MPYDIIRTLVRAMGFCCDFAFWRAVRGRSHQKVADRLGVSRNTVRYHRGKIRRKQTDCKECENCAYARFKGDLPRVELSSLREGVSDPFVD